jgi:hypothetical protein
MNERFKSLFDRAEYQARKYPGPDWEVYVEPSREQILEKFAELIVKECAKISRRYADKGICSDHYDKVGIDCMPGDMESYVLNYFGVLDD